MTVLLFALLLGFISSVHSFPAATSAVALTTDSESDLDDANSLAEALNNFFGAALPAFRSSIRGAMTREVDLWYDSDAKAYKMSAVMPGISKNQLKIWADDTNARRPMLMIETRIPKTAEEKKDAEKRKQLAAERVEKLKERIEKRNKEAGREVVSMRDVAASAVVQSAERDVDADFNVSLLKVMLAEDADFKNGKYELKDGLFRATLPRMAEVKKRPEIPLSLS